MHTMKAGVILFTAPLATGAFHHPSHLSDHTTRLFSPLSTTRTILNPQVTTTITTHTDTSDSTTQLRAKNNKRKGVYARPSAAIEQGSGFFVPGLEGSRVRILFGLIVLVLNYVNLSLFGVDADKIAASSALAFSGNVSGFFGVLLLVQGSVEFAKESGLGIIGNGSNSGSSSPKKEVMPVSDNDAADGDSKYLEQVFSSSLSDAGDTKVTEAIRWAAASYVALAIPATHVMLLEWNDDNDDDDDGQEMSGGGGTILYSLGNFLPEDKKSLEEVQDGIEAAIRTVYESKGGRVSVPATHPSSSYLLPEKNRRCVLLQKVEVPPLDGKDETRRKKLCLLVGSDQLINAYTKNDLKWLGNLSKYLSLRLCEV